MRYPTLVATTLICIVAQAASATGSDRHDLLSSKQRIAAVQAELERNGISAARISGSAYGEARSSASPDDFDALALERIVVISLHLDARV